MNASQRIGHALLLLFIICNSAYAQLNSNSFGRFDRSFGENGLALTQWQGLYAKGLHRLPDGRFISPCFVLGNSNGPELAFVRHHANGLPDTSVGQNGVVKVPGADRLFAVKSAIQPDGKLLYIGSRFWEPETRKDIFIARVGDDGQLDPSFAGDGLLIQDLSSGGLISDEELFDIKVLSDGKLLVAGSKLQPTGTGLYRLSIFLMRLGPDGTLDSSFGTSGFWTNEIGEAGNGDARGILSIQADGRILMGYQTLMINPDITQSYRILRFTPNGVSDNEFSGDGSVEIPTNATRPFVYLSTGPDGKILSLHDQEFTRLNPDGTFDQSFGIGGRKFFEKILPSELIELPNGKLLATGISTEVFSPNKTIGAVARFYADGTPDLRFGRSGLLRMEDPEFSLQFGWMRPLPDGTLLVAGFQRFTGGAEGRPFVAKLYPGK